MKGLNWSGQIWAVIKVNPHTMFDVLGYKECNLTSKEVFAQYHIHYTTDSDSKRVEEERSIKFLKVYLDDLQDTDEVWKFLQYTTGKRRIPACGWERGNQPGIYFCTNGSSIPMAGACYHGVHLPVVHKSRGAYLQYMRDSVEEGFDQSTYE